MENKKYQKLSKAALIISILPLAALLAGPLHIGLSETARSIWAVTNIVLAAAGLILSVICVKNSESRSPVNVLAVCIIALWGLVIAGILIVAVFINYIMPEAAF